MDLQTTFIKTDEGHIRIEEQTSYVRLGGKRVEVPFFYFQTKTEIKFAAAGEDEARAKTIAIRITRSMAGGLLEYFLGNQRFQDQVLRENQAHAVRYFQSNDTGTTCPAASPVSG